VYCASKAAVITLTQSAGLDLIKHGINVHAIAPGLVDNSTGTTWIRYSRDRRDSRLVKRNV
jgi:NAD(P)-dependent dehydrogenase (short-subunit alcohol dehydrogenase family)